MDAMALLCNMHADGPATIKVLRRAGVSTLSDITRSRHERLADLLGVSPAYARRFAREARLLGDRLGEIVFDAEEETGIEAAGADASSLTPISSSAVGEAPALLASQPSLFQRPAFDAAQRDAAERGQRGSESIGTAPRSSARVLPTQGTALRRGGIEGLDAAWCDRLVAQGVLTLETLVEAPALKLARRLGVPLTELMDLQLLAQHELAQTARNEMRTGAEEADTNRDRTSEPELDYVLYPPRRALDERTLEVHDYQENAEDRGLQDEFGPAGEESGATALASSSDGRSECAADAEDVGGPFV